MSLADWLELPGEELLARHAHLYVPERDPRYLRRNALVALGNAPAEQRELARRYADDPDPLLRDAARRGAHCADELADALALGAREHRAAEHDVVRAHAQVGDDDLTLRPRRRAVGQPAADGAVQGAPAVPVQAAVAVELRDVVAQQQRRSVGGLGGDRGRVVDRQREHVGAQGRGVDAPALGADRDARDHDGGAVGGVAGARGRRTDTRGACSAAQARSASTFEAR